MKKLQHNINTLIIGIGNTGRSDDALGWEFLNKLPYCGKQCDREYRYQLQIEDSELISHYTHVIFVDASRKIYKNGFSFYPCHTDRSSSFTTHKLSPGQTLALAQDLYNADTDAYVLEISGEKWELHTGMSLYAQDNLMHAIRFCRTIIPSVAQAGSSKPDLHRSEHQMDRFQPTGT